MVLYFLYHRSHSWHVTQKFCIYRTFETWTNQSVFYASPTRNKLQTVQKLPDNYYNYLQKKKK